MRKYFKDMIAFKYFYNDNAPDTNIIRHHGFGVAHRPRFVQAHNKENIKSPQKYLWPSQEANDAETVIM